jgi:hypothetical protein
MRNQKHNLENYTSPVNTFKLPSEPVEVRGRFTHAQIQYLKFKYFFFGFATGSVLLSVFYLAMNIYLKLAK